MTYSPTFCSHSIYYTFIKSHKWISLIFSQIRKYSYSKKAPMSETGLTDLKSCSYS